MMQPSELDTKSPLPSHIAKNRTPASKVSNHPSAGFKSSSKEAFSQEMSNKHIANDQNGVSSPLSSDTNNTVESSSSNGNGKSNCSSLSNGKGTLLSDDNKAIDNGNSTKTTQEEKGFLPVLKNPNFLALWGGQVFCQLADKVYLILMIALIKTQFQTAEQTISGWVSAIMIAFTIPAVLFGSVAGVFVDRWSKKVVLVASNVWRGILVLVIPLLLWFTHDWQSVNNLPVGFLMILGVTFLVSTLTQFFAPAEQAAIPLIVEEQHLLSANSLYTTTMMASVIVGFAIGEPLLASADKLWGQLGGSGGLGKEILVGGSYAIAGLILLFIATKEKPHVPLEAPHLFTDLRDGLRYIKNNRSLRNALIQLIVLFSVFAALTVLAVRMAELIPNLEAQKFGVLLAAGGVGIALGAIIIGQFGQRFSNTQLSLCGCIGMALCLIGLSIFSTQLYMSLGLILLLGVFGALIGIPMQTAIQTHTPTDMRGKVFGLQNNVINIALSLPLALAGVAETFFGLKTVFLGLAAITFFGSMVTWYKSID